MAGLQQRTQRYAVRRSDGCWLTQAVLDGRTVPVWTADKEMAYRLDGMSLAVEFALRLGVDERNDWAVEPLGGR